MIGKRVLGEGDGIQSADHPGFRDPDYRERREYIAKVALDYDVNDSQIPTIEYNQTEKDVWGYCYPKLKTLLKSNSCKETMMTIDEMEENVPGFGAHDIP